VYPQTTSLTAALPSSGTFQGARIVVKNMGTNAMSVTNSQGSFPLPALSGTATSKMEFIYVTGVGWCPA